MELRQLKYFMKIADSGNFSRAAEILHVAQPSLSQQIKNLEEELGVKLLLRHARGVTLTELGQVFYSHAQRIIRESEVARDSLRTQASTPSGRVTVGLPTSACRGIAIPLLKAIGEQQPNITLHIVEAMSGYLDDWIQGGRIDVALLYNHKAFEHVAWTEMIVEDLMLFVHPEHPLSSERNVSFSEVLDLPIVLPGAPHVMRAVIEELAVRQGTTVSAFPCDSLTAIAGMIRDLRAFAIMPHFALIDEIERGEMIAIPIIDPTPSWRLSVVVSHRTMSSRGSEAVARVLADVIREFVRSGVWRAKLLRDRGLSQTRAGPV